MIIGTRESELAMMQTQIFADALKAEYPDIEYEIKPMKSSGDLDLTSPLDKLQGYGAFVRELDAALLSGKIDVSVNSMKDMPIDTAEGLCIPAVLPRASPEDVMLPCGIKDLPHNAVVGTSSIRRSAMLLSIRPDLRTANLRGNIRTRLSKLDKGDYDAIILAKAGLERLSVDRPMVSLDPEVFIPAPAQGAIAVVCRKDDKRTVNILSRLNDPKTRTEVDAERRLMKLMGAGCSSPIGIHAELHGRNDIHISAISFEYSDEPIKTDSAFPLNDLENELLRMSDILKGDGQ